MTKIVTTNQRMMKRVKRSYLYVVSIRNKQSIKPLVHKVALGSGNSHFEQ
jgi:hypothetical protein